MDAENYKSQKDSFKQTILEHHRACISAASKPIQLNYSDFLIWQNSVDALADALSSHILEHDEIKEKIETNEKLIHELEKKFEKIYQDLSTKVNDEIRINENRISREYNKELIKLIRQRFVILTMLLHKKNYMEEISYIDGLDDVD